MKHAVRALIVGSAIAVAALQVLPVTAAEPVRLKYLRHYDHGVDFEPKHVMSAETVLDHYGLVSSSHVLCLIDLEVPPPLTGCISVIEPLEATTTAIGPDGYIYVNLLRGGFAIAHLDESSLALTLVGEVSEPDVFFEKMSVLGDRLYVAAHRYGIRIYDLSNPASPVLVGSLDDGFDDAWDIAVTGDTAYVADGGGGLKIVDLADETSPVIVAGEDPVGAAGTSEAVLLTQGHVYVAACAAGVAAYDPGDLSSRTLFNTPVCAKNLARVGDYLAVADIGGIEIFGIETDGALTPAARESAIFRSLEGGISLRLWHGVGAWGANRVMAADWDTLSIYELVDPALDDQPDVTASTQRIRFAPTGGSVTARVSNDGSGVLQLTSIHTTVSEFTVQPGAAVLQPGEFVDLTIGYSGAAPADGRVLIESNDPDENPLPIQVYGETQFLDPGEPAVPFTLESWTFDHATEQYEYGTFDLQAQAGKVVFFQVFSTW
jgi:hypothetical protein